MVAYTQTIWVINAYQKPKKYHWYHKKRNLDTIDKTIILKKYPDLHHCFCNSGRELNQSDMTFGEMLDYEPPPCKYKNEEILDVDIRYNEWIWMPIYNGVIAWIGSCFLAIMIPLHMVGLL